MRIFNLVLALVITPWLVLGNAHAAEPRTQASDSVNFKVLHAGENHAGGGYRNGLTVGSDGQLYGIAPIGKGGGSVFRMSPEGEVTVLHAFDDVVHNPSWLIQAPDGNFYGTTFGGGDFNYGVVFRITPQGEFTVVHSFDPAVDGGLPGSLTLGRNGDFYGTTEYGPLFERGGGIFRMSATGDITVLHTFRGRVDLQDGYTPNPLIQGDDGNFYGTTQSGGERGWGTFFSMTPEGELKVLRAFSLSDGKTPFGRLTPGPDGQLYGVAYRGTRNHFGTLFKLTLDGELDRLYAFKDRLVSAYPRTLMRGRDGNFYGVSSDSGAAQHGIVFRMTPEGQVKVLHDFVPEDGTFPTCELVELADGDFYGTTNSFGPKGNGTIFRIRVKHLAP